MDEEMFDAVGRHWAEEMIEAGLTYERTQHASFSVNSVNQAKLVKCQILSLRFKLIGKISHALALMIEALSQMPKEELALLLLECRDIVFGLELSAIIDLAEKEIQQDRHIILRMLVNPVAERLGLHASDELLDLKRKLDEEVRFWQMMGL